MCVSTLDLDRLVYMVDSDTVGATFLHISLSILWLQIDQRQHFLP